MAHAHSPEFLAIVNDAKRRVPEMTIEDYQARLATGEALVLVDVREDREWDAGHVPNAVHVGRGVLERDIVKTVPDKDTPLVLHCGGGFRSALAGDNLIKMGYRRVWSLAEGYRGWLDRGLPIVRG